MILYPGMKKCLFDLKKNGFHLAILSSNLKKNIKKFIKAKGIDIFDYFHCSTHILGKGSAIKKFLKVNHLKKNEAIYVGDEMRDIDACKKVGIKMIGVSWGLHTKEALLKSGVDFLVEKPSEILKIVSL
jgi:phosphoglycolate phosphatase